MGMEGWCGAVEPGKQLRGQAVSTSFPEHRAMRAIPSEAEGGAPLAKGAIRRSTLGSLLLWECPAVGTSCQNNLAEIVVM